MPINTKLSSLTVGLSTSIVRFMEPAELHKSHSIPMTDIVSY